jgi:hypothetical protein
MGKKAFARLLTLAQEGEVNGRGRARPGAFQRRRSPFHPSDHHAIQIPTFSGPFESAITQSIVIEVTTVSSLGYSRAMEDCVKASTLLLQRRFSATPYLSGGNGLDEAERGEPPLILSCCDGTRDCQERGRLVFTLCCCEEFGTSEIALVLGETICCPSTACFSSGPP